MGVRHREQPIRCDGNHRVRSRLEQAPDALVRHPLFGQGRHEPDPHEFYTVAQVSQLRGACRRHAGVIVPGGDGVRGPAQRPQRPEQAEPDRLHAVSGDDREQHAYDDERGQEPALSIAEPVGDRLLHVVDLRLQGRSCRMNGQHVRPGMRRIRLQRPRRGDMALLHGRQLGVGDAGHPGVLGRDRRVELLRNLPMTLSQSRNLVLSRPDLSGFAVELGQHAGVPGRDVVADRRLPGLVEIE